ncbi:transposase [Sphingomonas hankookensis]|nr:transposase [Sphingomonas hankookensis]WCP70474.1 transposase [Sphingomonas hankookensis]
MNSDTDPFRDHHRDARRRIQQDNDELFPAEPSDRIGAAQLATCIGRDATGPKLSRRSDLAVAIRYALTRWQVLTRYADDGRLEIDNNAAERSLRGITLGRKNWLFAGSDQGGHRAANIYSLVETARLNGVDPEAWLADTVSRIADHPARRVTELLPWNYRPT